MTTLEASIKFVSKAIDLHDFKHALKPLTVGVSGPQGSGKTYLASHLTQTLRDNYPKLRFIQFSVDDFYLKRSEQEKVTQEAAQDDNKLLFGRGLPGTHDLSLLQSVLHRICNNYKNDWVPVTIPFYDKSAFGGLGDRSSTEGCTLNEPVDVVICEGWFNGFMPLDQNLLSIRYFTSPVDSILQRHRLYQLQDINLRLSKYSSIWEMFTHFVILQTDTVENVYKWRIEQEHALIALKGQGMCDEEKAFSSPPGSHIENDMTTETELTADEIALYDRQIRLWGMATQLRLRSTKILVINLGAVGTECVKNLVLGGLNSIEILDSSVVKEEDFTAQFFLPNDLSIVGQLKLPLVVDNIKELNTKVDLSINTTHLDDALSNPNYFKKFDFVVATEISKPQIFRLNEITRKLNIPLHVSGMHGYFGYIIADLIQHTSYNEYNKSSKPRKVNVEMARNKKITAVKPDREKHVDVVTVEDVFSPLEHVFRSQEIAKYASQRELRRCSVLPIIFALFDISRPSKPSDEVDIDLLTEKVKETYRTLNLPLSSFSEDDIKKLSQQAFAEFSPTAAVLGGTLAQEVIRFLSKNNTPMNNVIILDATKAVMPIYSM
ncbi:hypothetical protein KGF57_004617 [Candida theae]|uniref:THIF-type NAD/FAD binding fold domain-containing protein n=1 Tax=Candida theae TaxID=1198502 RepID=A0AAD5BBG9_9ASCO|nr:uncharacterized protein KGF57_004617 [Candida theae]KAI5949794.1 hypothetical protein KGF57_004617 [Candida theae]